MAQKRFELTPSSVMAAFARAVTLLIFLAAVGSPVPNNKHSILVIVGGTGDLAEKYLWQSVFDVYLSIVENHHEESNWRHIPHVNHTIDLYAAGRSQQDKGSVILNKILTTAVTCDSNGDSERHCLKKLAEFINKVTYITLQEDEDYTIHCSELTRQFVSYPSSTTKELILFVAIPPNAYDAVLARFHKHCSTLRNHNVSIRLAVEKPFGLDKASAETMSQRMLSYFEEEEIYRVDHYLGKSVAKAVLPFRHLNPNIEKILNKDFVEKVEIFIKETVGVEDRFEVYNAMGVLRDIHQNHLTQLLILVAMDLPSDLSNTVDVHQNKERLLKQIEPVTRHNSLFGQYKTYTENSDSLGSNSTSNSPTFAASVVKINSPRWRSVPFLLVSGKQLDVRESFIRIVFKDNYVCVSHCTHKNLEEKGKNAKQIVFHIGNGHLHRPSILVSKSLEKAHCPENFKESLDVSSLNTRNVYGDSLKHFLVCSIVKDIPAYVSVFADILASRQEHFVSTTQLLLSWQMWDYVISAPKKIRIYEHSDPQGHLNFIVKESQLDFEKDIGSDPEKEDDERVVSHKDDSLKFKQTSATFLGQKLVTSYTDHLAFLLARDIDKAAGADIQSKGSFHIAFSGGTSAQKVFQVLAHSFANLHWHSIHVWQVDERCVPHQDERSNFQMIDRELLRFVDIPYSNIHAMPVYTGGRLCDPELGGAHAYAESLRHTVPNSQLDFIVLGLGTDGHTASLFPTSTDLLVDSNTYVITTEDGPPGTEHRMTMTLPLINRAKRVAIFVTGAPKQEIINKLEMHTSQSVEQFPILGVNPVNGTVCWYIDYSAYMEDDFLMPAQLHSLLYTAAIQGKASHSAVERLSHMGKNLSHMGKNLVQ